MARRDSRSRDGLLKASGSSPRQSLEADTDVRDTAKLLSEGDTKPREARAQSRRRRWTSWSCLTIIGIILVGIIGVAMSGGYFVYKHAPLNGQSPPWYPSPRGGTLQEWEKSYKKAHALVSKMSLVEKVNITTGVGWESGRCLGDTAPALDAGFPGLCLQDGPLGLRKVDNVTAFPAGITVGATFNKDIMYRRGRAYGEEARKKGVNVILGPGVGALGKIPAGGRNWEGFGTDPVLQGIAAAETIRGIQEEGVMATIKHFVGNEQEHFRQSFEWGLPNAISTNIDDRTMHEVYAWPFADSIRAGVASVMCSYNQVNNSYACGNSKLMNGILKDEMGFQGFVQSDWLAQRSGVASALAGLDVTMPGDGLHWAGGKSLFGEQLTLAVLNGSVPMERMNDMAARVVASWYQLQQDDEKKFPVRGPNFSSWTDNKIDRVHWSGDDKDNTGVVNEHVNVQGSGKEFHGRIAHEAAAEGIVLVKNDDAILPLSRKGLPSDHKPTSDGKCRVGIFGDDAGAGRGMNACGATRARSRWAGEVELLSFHILSPLCKLWSHHSTRTKSR
jgi:beta-glucosidase-like glycosyl hydrolase